MTKKKTTLTKPAVNLPKIFQAAIALDNTRQASAILAKFPPGNHTGAIMANLADGRPDIRGLLHYLAATFKPKAYLEIGVRLGYSMAMVASASPLTRIVGVDAWFTNWGGDPQVGPEGVTNQLLALGCDNPVEFISDDSHVVLMPHFKANPKERFDLILIDADSTTAGAFVDLKVTLPHLVPGGFLVFDDLHIVELRAAWEAIQEEAEKGLEFYSEGIVGLIHKG